VKRIVITLAVAALAVGGFAVGSSASSARKPVSKPTASIGDVHARLGTLADRVAKLRVRCRTLSCVNKSLTRLANGLKNLSTELVNCEHVVAVTQYNDYEQYFDSGPITALDYTVPGDGISNQMLVWTCAIT
jgi:hypothetical protein